MTLTNQLLPLGPQGTLWGQWTEIHPQSFCERGILPYLNSYDQSGRLPITHTFKCRVQSSPETREIRGYHLCTLCCRIPGHQCLQKGAFAHTGHTDFCGYKPEDIFIDSLVLVASRAYIHGLNKMSANKHFLTGYLPQAKCRRSRKKYPSSTQTLKEVHWYTLKAAA